MALELRRYQHRAVSLTPLIDVIFLLLLFFMLSSTFTRFAEIPLQNAGRGGADTEMAPLLIQLRADELRLNGEAVPFDDLVEHLANRRDREDFVLVTLGPDVTSQRLVDLLVILRGAPWLTVNVLE